MKLLATTLLSLLLSVISQNPSTLSAQTVKPHQFRWSENLAHELDYDHTIATAKELSPQERRDLLAYVLHRFTHPVSERDSMFEGIGEAEMRKLARDTRIEFADLNGDGINEIVVQGNGLGACGGTGNCIVLVLQNGREGWQALLDTYHLGDRFSGGFEKIRVMDISTNGFRDIVLASHVSATERTLEVFRFFNGRYLRSDCYYYRVVEGLKHPEISHGCGE